MRVTIAAIGRLKRGPERALIDDYLDRFTKSGRQLGLGPASVVDMDARKGGMAAEAELLLAKIPDGAVVVALDERGKLLTSPQFAETLGGWRDAGRRDCVCLIGGADGLDPALRDRADLVISFGKMVWPHMLARVMLAEQLYRAASILAGSPYHRE
ncbi:23S rRNA (pseudouridine1915-N3)-methyltransferase [Rubricella aquisinus]|uniref:Ribosomal RNA large subunit methyltransferase H n=1 Tax=Rubricella aquisinus TaxID=2028108 RepID=A0A840X387_9RHOB|nr:23S rRNA (pseudouridine(1915)-N(3))-methyltransferase RlmH [Rubricella aquisinus]MBB5515137.1 23S rRNA (pseudouridine1915-N3)-methyltransferase [Rubricella aquisinus]